MTKGSPPRARSGILVGGNFTLDHLKLIEKFPAEDTLVSILEESRDNGGLAYNVLKDLARLEANLRLAAIGCVGDDEQGVAILSDCRAHGISTAQLRILRGVSTSYTDVMTVRSTGRRTFFHHRGANDRLDVRHFDFRHTRAKLLHLGYLLLLERLDRPNRIWGTRAAMLLERARKAGMITSVDVITEDSHRYRSVVLPTLPAVDYLFLNELEAEKTTRISLRDRQGRLQPRRLEKAAVRLLEAGVRRAVVLHLAEGAGAYPARGGPTWQGSVRLPRSEIAGTTGAGDAFAAGFLFGVHQNLPLAESLRHAVCVAAASLRSPGASQGVEPLARCLDLGNRHGFRPPP
jgi:sugar/nucleoside kinase (ribokinase family)